MQLTEKEIQDHERWIRAGRSGPGRIDLRGADLSARKISAKALSAARFHECKFDGSNLSYTRLDEAELEHCSAVGASLAHCVLERARFVDCNLSQASVALSDFMGATLERTDMRKLVADRGRWNGAILRTVDLRDALLTDVVLDDVLFEDCDLRGADLSRKRPVLRRMGTTRGARFIRCDLRGADLTGRRLENTSFVACAFHDLVGQPALEGPVHLEQSDFSSAADGSDIRTQQAILAMWSPS